MNMIAHNTICQDPAVGLLFVLIQDLEKAAMISVIQKQVFLVDTSDNDVMDPGNSGLSGKTRHNTSLRNEDF